MSYCSRDQRPDFQTRLFRFWANTAVVLACPPAEIDHDNERAKAFAVVLKDLRPSSKVVRMTKRVRKMDMNMTSKDPLGEEIRAHVYTATIVHEPWRIVGIELQHDGKDIALLLTADEAGELGDALLKGAKELRD